MNLQRIQDWLKQYWLVLGLLLILSAIHISKHVIGLGAHVFPPALDPYYFAAQTAGLVEGATSLKTLAYAIPEQSFGYQPLLVLLLAGVAKVLPNVPIITLYEWFGVLMGAGLLFLLFMGLRRSFGAWPALAAAVAFAFSPYVFFRTYLTLPENLGYIFLVCFLGMFFEEKLSWRVVGAALVALVLMYFSHTTFVFALAITILALMIKLASRLSVRTLPVLVVIGLVLMGIAVALRRFVPQSILNPAYLGWTDIGLSTLQSAFYLPFIGLALIGLVAALVWAVKREQLAAKVLLVALVLIPGAFFYRGEPLGFGNLTTDRFYPFAALGIAILLGYALKRLDKVSPLVVRMLCGGILIAAPLLPVVDTWHWVYTEQEFVAAQQLSDQLPTDAIIIEQPIMDWLTRAVMNRTVPWESGALISLPRTELVTRLQSIRQGRPVYIMLSTTKLGRVYEIDTTAGTTRRVGYPKPYMVDIEAKDFADLPLVYRRGTVLVYQLLP